MLSGDDCKILSNVNVLHGLLMVYVLYNMMYDVLMIYVLYNVLTMRSHLTTFVVTTTAGVPQPVEGPCSGGQRCCQAGSRCSHTCHAGQDGR